MVGTLVACGEDPRPPVVTVTVGGDLTGTDPASVQYLCEPTGEADQFLSFMASPSSPVTYSFLLVVRAPRVFAPGSYARGDLHETSIISATGAGGTRYGTRATASATADETAALTVTEVEHPGAEPCVGWVRGTLDLQLVELIDTAGGQTVGPGRVTVHLDAE